MADENIRESGKRRGTISGSDIKRDVSGTVRELGGWSRALLGETRYMLGSERKDISARDRSRLAKRITGVGTRSGGRR